MELLAILCKLPMIFSLKPNNPATTHSVEPATPNEDSSTVKARSRPRAINKPSEVLLIAPPETALSRDHAAPSRDITMTSRDSVMTSRDTNDLEVRVKRHSLHSSPQVVLLLKL